MNKSQENRKVWTQQIEQRMIEADFDRRVSFTQLKFWPVSIMFKSNTPEI